MGSSVFQISSSVWCTCVFMCVCVCACACVYLSPQVGSVEEFQGQERKIVMVTTVRSSINYVKMDQDFNIGFLANEKVWQLFRYPLP